MNKRIYAFWKNNKGLIRAFLWTLILSTIVYFILKVLKIKSEIIIQISPIIALVFITLFYAVQTQLLVQQEKLSLEAEKEKRKAEYGEKRINNFLNPMLIEYRELNTFLYFSSGLIESGKMEIYIKDIKEVEKGIYRIRDLFNKYNYMATEHIHKEINVFIKDTIKNWPSFLIPITNYDYIKKWHAITETRANQLYELINQDIVFTTEHIQKTFGYYFD